LLPQALHVQAPAPIPHNKDIRPPAYNRLYCISISAYSYIKIKIRPTSQPSPVSYDNEGSNNEYESDDNDDAVGHGVAHGVLVFGDEPDSDLGGESESDVSIDEGNCTSVEGV
jgi:hypothetical protein